MHGQQTAKRTIWVSEDNPKEVCIIDQRYLPHELRVSKLRSVEDACNAIREMWVRGAPLIGATAAYGMYLGMLEAQRAAIPNGFMALNATRLKSTRPTAVNLKWAVDRQLEVLRQTRRVEDQVALALRTAHEIVEQDVETCRQIGQHGLELIKQAHAQTGQPVNVLTHCNAGRMACIEWGTATAPIYLAHEVGIPVHVYVDETRPRNQGAHITAWELQQAGIPFTLIVDNAGGHLMQQGQVDLCIVGTDRTTRNGDVANKIGTYLKALAAHDNQVPFYVALPSSSIDWDLPDGQAIPIEERATEEVTHIQGWDEATDKLVQVRIAPRQSSAANPGFDVTPARYITGLITERGICEASEAGLRSLFDAS